ncbi:MAG: SDR family NAD(P)-dependent oxidoreductase [Candidatus Acidiferrales bacterium]
MMRSLANQVAVITGGGSGIGKAIAVGLAAEGAVPVLVGRDITKLQAVAASLRGDAPGVRCYGADLSVPGQIKELAKQIERDTESVDILVHSAGVIELGFLAQAPLENLDSQYQVNVRAPYALTQGLLSNLRAHRGQIVFINSSAGLSARANVGQYAASKHALRGIADSLREEVNSDGVRVLSVFLGRTNSPMQAAVFKAEGRDLRPELLLQPEDVAAVVISALGLPSRAEVTDIHMRPSVKSY